jgi:DNA invertase Pin-like site-specific DNA recombinase
MTAALYARVSTKDQHCEMQLQELRALAARHGWDTIEYVEKASGKAGGRRPAQKRLLEDARLRKFDVVAVWKIDRFGRSFAEFVEKVQELDSLGIRFIAPTQGIDTDKRSPMAKLLMHILAVLAEFERDLIIERVQAGVDQYRRDYAAGRVGEGRDRRSKSKQDRPCGRPRKIFPRGRALELRAQGWSWNAIARDLGVKRSTLRMALKEK